jgi:TRAP-type transport system periplasmic protein
MHRMKIRGMVLTIALCIVMSLCIDANAKTVLKLATDSGANGSPSGEAIKNWAHLIESATKGTKDEIKVDIFYENELGGASEVFDLFVAGEVDLMLNWPMTSYDKRMGIRNTPYLFMNWTQAKDAYLPGGWLNEITGKVHQDLGLNYFGPWPEGFAGVATRGGYTTTIDGARKMKVRTPPIFPFPQTMQALGYQTAAIDWGEVYTSIQTGVVDGEAGNIIYWAYEYFRDVLDYYVRTKHNFVTGSLSMNQESWEKLTPNQQTAVAEAAKKVMEKQFVEAKNTDQYYVDLAIESGMGYIVPSAAEINIMAKNAREKVWPLMEKELGKEIMDAIRENAPAL